MLNEEDNIFSAQILASGYRMSLAQNLLVPFCVAGVIGIVWVSCSILKCVKGS